VLVDISDIAAVRGDLPTLQWVYKRSSTYVSSGALMQAACHGHSHIIDWLLTNDKQQRKEDVWLGAAMGGHLGIMQAHGPRPRYPNFQDVRAALRGGHLDVVRWMVTEQYVYPLYWWMDLAVSSGSIQLVRWLCEGADMKINSPSYCYTAADGNHLALLQWLRANGCPWWDTVRLIEGSTHADTPAFQWAFANGAPRFA